MSDSLLNLVAGVINVPAQNLTLESGPENVPEWDSLAQISIVSAIEQIHKIRFTMPEILAIRTILDLQKIVDKYSSNTE